MEDKTILILGGYGGAGLPIARLLLQESQVKIILAGRNGQRAEEAAIQLNRQFPGGRVSGRQVDASNGKSLTVAFSGFDMGLVCSPTSQYAEPIARAALSAGADYLDIYYPQRVVPALKGLEPSIKEAGRCFITQAGCHPGLPATLVRYAAAHFSHLQKANIGMLMHLPYIGSPDSLLELVEEISDYRAELFQEGQWRKADYKDARRIDFGPGFGILPCVPMMLEEMRNLPEQLHLEEAGLYGAGFNWFVDWLVIPFGIILGRIRKGLGVRSLARLMTWGIKAFSQPPFGIAFKLEAEGEKEGKPRSLGMLLRHQDGYQMTAIPVVACLLQYLEGSIARPGLWLMGQAVDPVRLVEDMERMGVEVHVSMTAPGVPADS